MLAFFCNAQIIVDATSTPDSLVQNHLLGSGVYVSNVTYTGSALQIGSFTGGTAGISNGIIMSSGSVDSTIAWAPASIFRSSAMNNNSDSSLAAIVSPQTVHDASVLEFDFKVASDSVKFNFVFGSEEYNDWVNTAFNDVFGFFISGPGIVGEQNIALIPGTTTPVSINNVNNGGPYSGVSTGPCNNCAYFVDNIFGTTFAGDAYTTVLTAQAAVQPCTIYHIKLAVADVSDQVYDSFVMLEDNSFQACAIPRLYVNNAPVLVDSITICSGSSVQISSLQAPNYLWSTGETTQTITVTQTGDYVASVFEGACYVTSKIVHVEVLTLPAPIIANNSSLITSTVIDPAYTYTWYHDGNLITGATTYSYTVNTGGCYLLIITDVNGCSVTSNNLCLTFTGVNNVEEKNAVQVIPNPFKHSAKISFANPANEKVTVTVYDAIGKEISNSKFVLNQVQDRNLGIGQIELINKNLERGVYFFEIRNESSEVKGKGKLVIE